MKIGAISDPHGCSVGLETVVKWLKDKVDAIICTGDIVSFGPNPNECVSILIDNEIICIMGNSDREIIENKFDTAISNERLSQIQEINRWTVNMLSNDSSNWLKKLSPSNKDFHHLLAIHGGLNSDSEIINDIKSIIFPDGINTIIAGHLHLPFLLEEGNNKWVNLGSVGRPCDGDPRASAVILESLDDTWNINFHRVSFDLNKAENNIYKSGIPFANKMINTQKEALWW